MLKVNRLVAVVAALFLVSPSFARTITKQARANDVATEYSLHDNGDLFRKVHGRQCQVTTHVLDFKVSQHPQDAAMIYFVKDENTDNLYVLHNTNKLGNCPKASTKMIMADLAKSGAKYRYNVVSNTNTTIVNVALNRVGHLVAWDNNVPVLEAFNVEDYTMHTKFGAPGVPFSSYVLFAINYRGYVLKVKGVDTADSRWDESERFNSLTEFKQRYRIQ